MEMDFRKALLDTTQHLLVPINLEVWMEAALHQYARPAKLDGLMNLVVNSLEIEDVALFRFRSLEWTIEGTEGAVLSAVVCVVNFAVDDLGDDSVRMELTADRVSFHADANQVVGLEHIDCLLLSEGHAESQNPSQF